MTGDDRSHQELQELLGAHALDALDADEAAAVEAHVARCPACRSELDTYRAMAAAMATGSRGPDVVMPPALWDRIATEIGAPPPLTARARDMEKEDGGAIRWAGAGSGDGAATAGGGAGVLGVAGGAGGGAGVAVVDDAAPRMWRVGTRRAPGGQARRRARGARWGAAAAAVAAVAAAIILLAVSLGSVDGRVGRLQAALAGHGVDAGVAAALADPAHLDATFRSPSGRDVGAAVVAGGHGYLLGAHMAVLPGSRTYQLWAVVNGKPVSLGLLGNRVTEAAFTMGTLSPEALAVTVEPARGSVVPTTAPVATARM